MAEKSKKKVNKKTNKKASKKASKKEMTVLVLFKCDSDASVTSMNLMKAWCYFEDIKFKVVCSDGSLNGIDRLEIDVTDKIQFKKVEAYCIRHGLG